MMPPSPDTCPPPLLALAPMQDVTDLPYVRALSLLKKQGRLPLEGADYYVTPYFRVVAHSDFLDPDLLRYIEENPMDKPIYAQVIGSDRWALCRIAKKLEAYPVAGIDLNLGCPAPVVCRKDAGGAGLKDLVKLDALLGSLRESISKEFTVKIRIGYTTVDEFDDILDVLKKHDSGMDRLVIHARTVKEGYHTAVHPELVRLAVESLQTSVIANGNIVDPTTALAWMERAHPAGLMIGRGVIRNPWLFDQIRAASEDRHYPTILLSDLYDYTQALYEASRSLMDPFIEKTFIHGMKKFLNYIAQGIHPDFEYRMRRALTVDDYQALCKEYLAHDEPFTLLPPERPKLLSHFSELLKDLP